VTGPQEPRPSDPPAQTGAWGAPPPWSGGKPAAVPGDGPGGWAPAPVPAQTDTRAVVALVLAVLSFVLVPFVPAVVALVLARRSQRDIAASGGRLVGDGLARAARIVAWVNIVLSVLAALAVVLVLVAFAVYGFGP
jgi:hypothetical protein